MHPCTIAAEQRRAERDGRCRLEARLAPDLPCSGQMRLVSIFLAAALVAAPAAHAARRTIVSVGEASSLGLPLSTFSDPALDDQGRVAFVGAATGLFRRTDAGIVRVLAAGDVVQARTVAGVGPADVGAGGCAAFRVSFTDGGAAVLRDCGSGLEQIAGAGGPGPAGGTILGFGADVRVGPGDRVAFTALLGQRVSALVLAEAGSLTELARTGGSSPAGGTFSGFRLAGISAVGHVGFRGAVTGGRSGLFYSRAAGTLTRLAVDGDATPVGGTFGTVGLASLNASDQWVFRAELSDGRIGLLRADTALLVAVISPAVFTGQPTPIGGTFVDLPSGLLASINGSGTIAFRATVEGASYPSGVFVIAPDGTVDKVVAAGEPTAAGQLLRLRETELADDGSLLVRATLLGGTPGIFRARGGRIDPFAVLGEGTDLGGGFRFSDPAAVGAVETALFLGTKEALFVADGGPPTAVAVLGDPTPVGGTYTVFDPPSGGGRQLVFSASIRGGKVAEAIFTLARGGMRPVASVGDRIARGCRIVAFFQSTLDDLARAGVGYGGIAFEAGVGSCDAATGLFARGRSLPGAVALAGRRAPGGSYRAFGTPAVVGPSAVAFVAQVGGTNDTAVVLRRGQKARAVARSRQDTNTRIAARFRAFDSPAAAPGGLVFRATLDQGRGEGLFFARGRRLAAFAAAGDTAPGGGVYQSLHAPVSAGRALVFKADVTGGTAASGLYRVAVDDVAAEPPSASSVAAAGDPSPHGGVLLTFGAPAGNHGGTIAFGVEIAGGTTRGALVVDDPD